MSKHNKKQRREQRRQAQAVTQAVEQRQVISNSSDTSRLSPVVFVFGLLCLLLSVTVSFVLVLQHLAGMSIPGCGPGSPCALAAGSVWGKVPVVNWPVSSVGLAYFVALAIGWFRCMGGIPSAFRWIVRLGALISASFLIIMIVNGYVCMYCVSAHIGNLAFWLIIEWPKSQRPLYRFREAVTVGIVFVIATGVLAGVETIQKQSVAESQEEDLAESTQRIIERTAEQSRSNQLLENASTEGFTGRWRVGPENAPIRVVIFSDYQCPDCRKIETQARQLLDTRDDISLSAKHFPMSDLCNQHLTNFNPHPNACWAARAAEAAGMLAGNDAFWKMHNWLFDRKGVFTNKEDLRPIAEELGLDVDEFVTIMSGDETLRRIQMDTDEATSLGLHFTPMIFVNGEELRGFTRPDALIRTVEQVAATNPPPGSSVHDYPPLAVEKYISDWREQQQRSITDAERPRVIGPADAPVHIVMWSDYRLASTTELEGLIRELVSNRDDVRYEYRHYPFDKRCNVFIKAETSAHPQACRAAQAAEAALSLAGEDAFWTMHEWLLNHFDEPLTNDILVEGAAEFGITLGDLLVAMNADENVARVHEDASAGNRLTKQGIPFIYINGKWAPRWKLEGQDILGLIVEEASKMNSPSG